MKNLKTLTVALAFVLPSFGLGANGPVVSKKDQLKTPSLAFSVATERGPRDLRIRQNADGEGITIEDKMTGEILANVPGRLLAIAGRSHEIEDEGLLKAWENRKDKRLFHPFALYNNPGGGTYSLDGYLLPSLIVVTEEKMVVLTNNVLMVTPQPIGSVDFFEDRREKLEDYWWIFHYGADPEVSTVKVGSRQRSYHFVISRTGQIAIVQPGEYLVEKRWMREVYYERKFDKVLGHLDVQIMNLSIPRTDPSLSLKGDRGYQLFRNSNQSTDVELLAAAQMDHLFTDTVRGPLAALGGDLDALQGSLIEFEKQGVRLGKFDEINQKSKGMVLALVGQRLVWWRKGLLWASRELKELQLDKSDQIIFLPPNGRRGPGVEIRRRNSKDRKGYVFREYEDHIDLEKFEVVDDVVQPLGKVAAVSVYDGKLKLPQSVTLMPNRSPAARPAKSNSSEPFEVETVDFSDEVDRLLADPRLQSMTVGARRRGPMNEAVKLLTYLERNFKIIRSAEAFREDFEYYKDELEKAVVGLMMRNNGSIRVVGRAGTGKSYFSNQVLMAYLMSQGPEELHQRLYIKLDDVATISDSGAKGSYENKFSALKKLASVVPITLVMEEMHIFYTATRHSTSKTGFFEFIKDELANGRIKIVGNLTQDDWRDYFSNSATLSDRFPIEIVINEPDLEKLIRAMKGFVARNTDLDIQVSDEILHQVVATADRFSPTGANPRRTLILLDYLLAFAKRHNIQEIQSDHVLTVAKQVYGNGITELSPEKIALRLQNLDSHLNQRLVGLKAAKGQIREILSDHFFHRIERVSESPASVLLYGELGGGKTSFAEAVADGLGFQFKSFMMADFKTPYHVEVFKRMLAQQLLDHPYSVVFFDEMDEAHPDVVDALIDVLDRGVFSAHLSDVEGENKRTEIRSAHAFFMAATNVGGALANQPHQSNDFLREAKRKISAKILDRIRVYIPIESPKEDAIKGIVRAKWISEVVALFTKKGKTIAADEDDVISQILSHLPVGEESVSTRALQREIEDVRRKISSYFVNHPTATAVEVSWLGETIELGPPGKKGNCDKVLAGSSGKPKAKAR